MTTTQTEVEALRAQNDEYTKIIERLHEENERLSTVASSAESKLTGMEMEYGLMKHSVEDVKDATIRVRNGNTALRTQVERLSQDYMSELEKVKSDLKYVVFTYVMDQESELSKANVKIAELTTEIQGLKGNAQKLMSEGNEERTTMHEALLSMTQQKTQLLQELETVKSNLVQTTKELADAQAQLGIYKTKEMEFNENKVSSEQHINDLTQQVNALKLQMENDKNNYKQKISDISAQLDAATKKCQQAEASSQVLLIELQNERDKVKELQNNSLSGGSIKNGINGNKMYSTDEVEQIVEQKMKDMQEEFNKMQELVELSQQQKEILDANINNLMAELQHQGELNSSSKEREEHFQNTISALENDKKALNTKIISLENDMKAINSKLVDSNKKVVSLEQEKTKLLEQIKSLNNLKSQDEKCPNCEKYETELTVLRNTVKAECTERAELLRTLGQYQQKIEALERRGPMVRTATSVNHNVNSTVRRVPTQGPSTTTNRKY